MSCTDNHFPVSCAAAPPLAPLLATPLCVYVSTPEQQCTFNPTQSPATCCIHFPPRQVLLLFVSVLEPNMPHCLRQQPLAQTARTPRLHKSELPGSSLSPISICSPVHTFKPTRGSRCLAAARNSEWFLSFGPTIRHAIASTPESAATAGYLLLVCRSQTPFRLAKSVFPINTYWTCRLE